MPPDVVRTPPDTFEAVFDDHFRDVHGYVARRLGRDVADDVASETFLTAFRLRDRFDATKGDRLAWLYGIATNLMRRHHRDEVRSYRAMSRLDPTDSVASHDDRVATRVSAEHLRGELAAALAGLSRGDRDVLMLIAQTRARLTEPAPVRSLRPRLVIPTAVVAVVPIVVSQPSQDTRPAQEQAATPRSAKEILLVAVEHAESDATRAGRFWCVRTVFGALAQHASVGTAPNSYGLLRRTVVETWLSADGTEADQQGRRDVGTVPDDKKAWLADGSPTSWNLGYDKELGRDYVLTATPGDGEPGAAGGQLPVPQLGRVAGRGTRLSAGAGGRTAPARRSRWRAERRSRHGSVGTQGHRHHVRQREQRRDRHGRAGDRPGDRRVARVAAHRRRGRHGAEAVLDGRPVQRLDQRVAHRSLGRRAVRTHVLAAAVLTAAAEARTPRVPFDTHQSRRGRRPPVHERTALSTGCVASTSTQSCPLWLMLAVAARSR
jgi:RNA polymerase sigma factor (sigma-70 family)